MENLGRAFTFMFEDRAWPGKVILGGVFILLSCVIIGIPFILGYQLEMSRRAYENKEVPLPEWDNMGDKFTQGLIFLIIVIIYWIPGSLLFLLPCLGPCFSLVYALIFALIAPYITTKFALTRDFNEAFNFQKIMEFVKANIGDIVIVILISIAMGIVASFGVILLIVGVLFTLFWSILGQSYLYGKLLLKADSGAIQAQNPD